LSEWLFFAIVTEVLQMAYLDESLAEDLCRQLNKELQAAYFYYAVSTWFGRKGLKNLESWFSNQAEEELEHANKLKDFLLERDVVIKFYPLQNLDLNFDKAVDIFKWGLSLEEQVELDYKQLSQKSLSLNDFSTFQFLQWFLNEQIEEIDHFKSIVDLFSLLANNPSAEFFVDQQVGLFKKS